jgi:PPM family protein phosphatase
MQIERDFAGRQWIGSRHAQEDYYAFTFIDDEGDDAGILLILADGMGGHEAGERASMIAVENFLDAFHQYQGPPASRLRAALDRANDAIRDAVTVDQRLQTMGTTLVAVAVQGDKAIWISLGDSPLFLFRNGMLQRLNADHSLAALLQAKVDAGMMSLREAATHPDRNVLQAALIGEDLNLIDQPELPFPLRAGDVLVAASDGILTLKQIQISVTISVVHDRTAGDIADSLLHAIKTAAENGQDNTTVAVIKIP